MPQVNAPSLKGKIALVTGASRGIGRAIAQRFAAAGATVVVTARSLDTAKAEPGTLQETVDLIERAGGKSFALAADLEKAADREALVARAAATAGGLDILVNNAGYAEYAPIAEMSDATYDRTMDHYLRAPFVLSREAIPLMKSRGAGWIVNVGSVTAQPPIKPYGWFEANGGSTLYAAVKAALNRFTQGLAAECLASDIAVNVIAPSTAIATPGASRYIPSDYPTERVEYLAESALQLAYLPAAERTGLVTHSMHYPIEAGFMVYELDGKTALPKAVVPAESHAGIVASGEWR
ncbi:MAG: SDR family NAD(P)-dependent oxidoreductase [Deltaproteobacteria bacterium]|nr:SDR family NAD(P)-dependent oxidoreductase [Deltaproteobacteria bacterium]